jgi:hypothetical protein
VDRHSSLLVGIGKEYVKERYMPVVLSRISLLGKALLYTQLGMASYTPAATSTRMALLPGVQKAPLSLLKDWMRLCGVL